MNKVRKQIPTNIFFHQGDKSQKHYFYSKKSLDQNPIQNLIFILK